jgi:hypothetical protein
LCHEYREQQRAIDALVTDRNDGLAGMPRENKPQRLGRSANEVLKRISAWKAEQVSVGTAR